MLNASGSAGAFVDSACNIQMLLVLLRRSLNVLEQVIEDACKASSGPALGFSHLGFEPGLSPDSTNFCRVEYLLAIRALLCF